MEAPETLQSAGLPDAWLGVYVIFNKLMLVVFNPQVMSYSTVWVKTWNRRKYGVIDG
tara:strand:+ start:29 stop:199 length:171 start_codon:yes stop_codon:yes gene_type:complete